MNETVLRRIEENDQTLKQVSVISTRELRQLITAVQENSNIDFLAIDSIIVELDIATALSQVLPRMPFLEEFKMYNCDCSNADGLSILASALASKASLHTFWLRSCQIGNRGAEIIASSFGNNRTLKTLGLNGNLIGDEGAIALASLLSTNSSIKNVVLMRNNIGADGIFALAASLSENRSVEAIDLGGNTDEPDIHFNRVLYNDSSIESVIASNHTLKVFGPGYNVLHQLLALNAAGPEKAVRAKIIRFLNEQPTFVITMGIEANLMPSYLKKIGRDCQLNAMFELICSMPNLLDSC